MGRPAEILQEFGIEPTKENLEAFMAQVKARMTSREAIIHNRKKRRSGAGNASLVQG